MPINPKLDEEVLRRMYLDEGLSTSEIEKRLGVSNYGVFNALKRFGIPLRDKSGAARLRHSHTWKADWESLAEEYKSGHTLEEIAEKANCTLATASSHLKRMGIAVRPRGCETPLRPYTERRCKRLEIDVEKAAEMNRNGSTLTEIGKRFGGLSAQVVSKRFKEANVPVITNRASQDEFKNVQFYKREVARAINATACAICGETRAVALCHILPRHRGGELTPDNTVALCPTHHHCFDHGRLKGPELAKIRHILEKAAERGYTHPHY